MLQGNLTTYSRAFAVFIGMVKVGYALMILQAYYFEIVDLNGRNVKQTYYKQVPAFAAGMILPFILQKNVSRFLIIFIAEVLYIILMVVIPFTSSEIKLYGFLFGGGISILLYPLYGREHFIQQQHIKLFIFLWFALGVGIIYYLGLSSRNNPFISPPLYLTDDITSYIFGSFSMLNKLRETPYYYSLKQENDDKLLSLVQQMFKANRQDIIFNEFKYIDQNSYFQPLLDDHIQNKQNKQQVLVLYFLAFFAGASNVFYLVGINAQKFLLFFNNNQFDINETSYEAYQYYLYILIVIICLIRSLNLQNKRRKFLSIFDYTIVFLTTVILIIGQQNKYSSNFYNIISILQLIYLLGIVAPMVFSLPFWYLNIYQVYIYFSIMIVGTFVNKIYFNLSSLEEGCNQLLFSAIAQLSGIVAFAYLKKI